ncbi:hypothetical protein AK88_01851 [Plasmodium fragile]|uniref:Schizont-infected cell agglutination extracellular alpha domain-containing protein n=1 Tax=Plasmodium fragile TaxID=5857 RepID=A0A0D9QP78_PLAFR|nr:uncharacterized protein AK88_01851 [Plasmodium fragile]KJP88572.1 hypothetical protein AK88_01851 [Plasmodium fragile]
METIEDTLELYATSCEDEGWVRRGREEHGPIYKDHYVGDVMKCRLMVGALYFVNEWSNHKKNDKETSENDTAMKAIMRCLVANVFAYILAEIKCQFEWTGIDQAWYIMQGMGGTGGFVNPISSGTCALDAYKDTTIGTGNLQEAVKKWLQQSTKIRDSIQAIEHNPQCNKKWAAYKKDMEQSGNDALARTTGTVGQGAGVIGSGGIANEIVNVVKEVFEEMKDDVIQNSKSPPKPEVVSTGSDNKENGKQQDKKEKKQRKRGILQNRRTNTTRGKRKKRKKKNKNVQRRKQNMSSSASVQECPKHILTLLILISSFIAAQDDQNGEAATTTTVPAATTGSTAKDKDKKKEAPPAKVPVAPPKKPAHQPISPGAKATDKPGGGAAPAHANPDTKAQPVAAKPVVTTTTSCNGGGGAGVKQRVDTAKPGECQGERLSQWRPRTVHVIPNYRKRELEKLRDVFDYFKQYMHANKDHNEAYGVNCYNTRWDDITKPGVHFEDQTVADVVRCRVMTLALGWVNGWNNSKQDKHKQHKNQTEKEMEERLRCEVANIFGHLLRANYCPNQELWRRGVEYSRIAFRNMHGKGKDGIGGIGGPVVDGRCTACGYGHNKQHVDAVNLEIVNWLLQQGKVLDGIETIEEKRFCNTKWAVYTKDNMKEYDTTRVDEEKINDIKEVEKNVVDAATKAIEKAKDAVGKKITELNEGKHWNIRPTVHRTNTRDAAANNNMHTGATDGHKHAHGDNSTTAVLNSASLECPTSVER